MNYGASLESLFQAYFDCRKNKRNTMNALRFETDYESNLIALRDELNSSTWNPGRSIAFVIDRPVRLCSIAPFSSQFLNFKRHDRIPASREMSFY